MTRYPTSHFGQRNALPGRFLVVCLAFLSSCSASDRPSVEASGTGASSVVVSLPVVGLIAQPLLPVGVTWTSLLPSGGSPHAFEPSPSHGVLLHEGHVLVAVHPHLDGWATRLTSGPVILLENEDEHAGHDHTEENGHIWMDPVHVRAILPELADALCQHVPESCNGMDARVQDFSDALAALDQDLRLLFQAPRANMVRPRLLTALPFIHPLLERYEVPYVGPIQRIPGDMVSPSELAALLDSARDHAAWALVSQQSMISSAMDQIASDQALELVLLDETGYDFETYEAFILHAARKLVPR